MTNIIYYQYYYRYAQYRKNILNTLNSENYQQAKTDLDMVIAEHDSRYSSLVESRRDFNFGESIIMKHAKRHLDTMLVRGNTIFFDNDGNMIHHSDKIKYAISAIPKPYYRPPMET